MEAKWHELRFDLNRNMRYHESREAWFSRTTRLIKVASLVSGTAAGATLLSSLPVDLRTNISAVLAFGIALLTMVDLIFDLPGGARAHASLKTKFASILANLELEIASLTPEADFSKQNSLYLKTRSEMVRLYGEEPPTYLVADAIAWNETARSLNGEMSKDKLIPILWNQRLFGHVFRYANFDASNPSERKQPPAITQ